MKNTLKILIVIPNDSWGGAEALLKKIVSEYKGENIELVYFRDKNIPYWLDLAPFITQRYMSPNNEKKGLINFFFSTIFSKQKHYDYIFTSHVYITGMMGFLLTIRALKTKYFIARESTSIFLRYSGASIFTYKMAYFIGYRKMNLLVCQTEVMKKQLIDNFPKILKRTKVKVIPNPISLEMFKKKSKEQIDIDLPEKYIVTAGRFIEEKGYDILVESFEQVKRQHTDLKLIIIGTGRLMEDIRELTKSKGLSNDIILAGFSNNVFPYFKNAELCVISSRLEGFPNVLLEMMSQNSKVVSTLCAGGIEDVPGIITCKPNSVEALTKSILKGLLINDADERKILISNFLKNRDIKTYLTSVMNEL